MSDEPSDVQPEKESDSPKPRHRFFKIVSTLAIILFLLFLWLMVDRGIRGGLPITISKETTRITEPLRPDGYVDYTAALNQKSSEGITPENNAAVLFWQAMGPSEIGAGDRERFFKLLGIEPLPETGDYFIALDNFMKPRKAARKAAAAADADHEDQETESDWLTDAMKRPWSVDEFPDLADWLAANEKPLRLIIEATKRTKWYNPLIHGEDETLIYARMPFIMASRESARALTARAMLRLSEGKTDEAWDDLLACHRFARLVGQGPMLIDALIGSALEGVACVGDRALLQDASLTAAQIAKMRDDLAKLSPLPIMADVIDTSERFTQLDAISGMARNGLSTLNPGLPSSGSQPKSSLDEMKKNLTGLAIDFDVLLRMANQWIDRMVEAFRKPTFKERKEAVRIIEEDIRREAAAVKDWSRFGLSLLSGPRRAISNVVGRVIVALFMPGIPGSLNARDRTEMRFEVTKLAFALAAYRADHGDYPEKLADLLPKYVAEIPKDVFSESDLIYRRDADGYLLYSVGVNGVDDGGRNQEDDEADEGRDDLAVRVPMNQ